MGILGGTGGEIGSFQKYLFMYIRIWLAKCAVDIFVLFLEVQSYDHRCLLETLSSLILSVLMD